MWRALFVFDGRTTSDVGSGHTAGQIAVCLFCSAAGFQRCSFIRDVGLSAMLVYPRCWFIRDVGLFAMLVYSRCWFIRDVGLFAMLVYLRCWFIRHADL